MTQTINDTDWTQVTGLENGKTYIIQALYKPNYSAADTIFDYMPVKIMWLQSANAPQSTDIGVIDNVIKASGSVDVYVRTQSAPCEIVVQEVI